MLKKARRSLKKATPMLFVFFTFVAGSFSSIVRAMGLSID